MPASANAAMVPSGKADAPESETVVGLLVLALVFVLTEVLGILKI